MQGEADLVLAEAEALKLLARLEDLTVWGMKKVKQSRKGSKTYTYWMTSWREGDKTRNVQQGVPVIWMPRLPGRWLDGEVIANIPKDVLIRTSH